MLFASDDDGVGAGNRPRSRAYLLARRAFGARFRLGLLDTDYLDVGDPPTNGTGLQPGIPFQYAPETSYALGVRYRLPLSMGAEMLFVGNYGWMDEYQRFGADQLQPKNPDGSNDPEPAYGILNARVVYHAASGKWQLSLFGTNLTNEWYVNGGVRRGLFFRL